MHKKLGKRIKFHNGNGYIINDYQSKYKIINYIYDTIDPFKYRYRLLKSKEDMNYLKSNPHYIAPNFFGFNYFLIFIGIKEIDYCVCIESRTLKRVDILPAH